MKNKKMWELKQSIDNPNQLDMYIYGDVQSDGYDWWNGEDIKSETSANYFREELQKYKDINQINIYINSYGGSVFEGTAIYSQLKRHSAKKIVYIDGFACSVASVIAMAGDTIIMPKNTMMMIHNIWTSIAGNAKELRQAADNLDVMMESNRQAYLDKAGDKLTEDELIEMLEGETWLTAEQCIEFGLADELLDKEVDLTDANLIFEQNKNNINLKQKYFESFNQSINDLNQDKKVTDIKASVQVNIDSDEIVQKLISNLEKKYNLPELVQKKTTIINESHKEPDLGNFLMKALFSKEN